MIDLIKVKQIEISKSETIEHFKSLETSTDSTFYELLNEKISENKAEKEHINDEESHLAVKENQLQDEECDEPENETQVKAKAFNIVHELVNSNQEDDEKKADTDLPDKANLLDLNPKKIENANLINISAETKTEKSATKTEDNMLKVQELLSGLDLKNIQPMEAEKIIASIKEFLASPEALDLSEKSKKGLTRLVETLSNQLKLAANKESIALPDKIDLKQIIEDIEKKLAQNDRSQRQISNKKTDTKIEIQPTTHKVELSKEAHIETQVTVKKDVSENKKSDIAILNNRNTSTLEGKNSSNNQSQAQNNFNQSREFKEQLNAIIERGKIQIRDAKNASFEIRLHPKELGSLNMNIGLKQGVVTGKFLVDNEQAKNLLMENLLHIRTQLEETGVAIGDFQVNVRSENQHNREDIELKSARVLNAGLKVNSVVEYNSVSFHDGSLNLII